MHSDRRSQSLNEFNQNYHPRIFSNKENYISILPVTTQPYIVQKKPDTAAVNQVEFEYDNSVQMTYPDIQQSLVSELGIQELERAQIPHKSINPLKGSTNQLFKENMKIKLVRQHKADKVDASVQTNFNEKNEMQKMKEQMQYYETLLCEKAKIINQMTEKIAKLENQLNIKNEKQQQPEQQPQPQTQTQAQTQKQPHKQQHSQQKTNKDLSEQKQTQQVQLEEEALKQTPSVFNDQLINFSFMNNSNNQLETSNSGEMNLNNDSQNYFDVIASNRAYILRANQPAQQSQQQVNYNMTNTMTNKMSNKEFFSQNYGLM